MNVRYRFVFNLFRNGPENLRHFFNQSDSKQKIIATWSPAFPRASKFPWCYFEFLFVPCGTVLCSWALFYWVSSSKTKGITTANQTKSWLVSVLHLIGQECGTSFPHQAQSFTNAMPDYFRRSFVKLLFIYNSMCWTPVQSLTWMRYSLPGLQMWSLFCSRL